MKNTGDDKQSTKSWLQYVTEQSWEPELLISGLAIYATLNLPGIFYSAYRYYQFNLQVGSGIFDDVVPLMIYCVFTTSAYILMGAFIIHFVIRAFWVGFIGLISVYGDGIQYDKLPYSDLYKKEARKKLGSSELMAMRLDHISSLIFSVAFALVLLMCGGAFLYLIFFLLYNVMKLFIDPAFFETYADILSYSFILLLISFVGAIYILNMKRFRSNPKLARWHFNLSWKANAIIMPGVYKPLQFIQLTFLSNLSTKKFIAGYAVLFMVFFSILMGVVIGTIDENIFDTRNYFSSTSSYRHMESHEYLDNLEGDDLLQNAALGQPIIESNMMKVFIPYPKQLDEVLKMNCEPHAVPDSLGRDTRRRLINEHNLTCAEDFFSFAIDDSLQLEGELIFTRLPENGQEGYVSYLDISGISAGRHTFRVNRKPLSEADSTRLEEDKGLRFETEIPFWKN